MLYCLSVCMLASIIQLVSICINNLSRLRESIYAREMLREKKVSRKRPRHLPSPFPKNHRRRNPRPASQRHSCAIIAEHPLTAFIIEDLFKLLAKAASKCEVFQMRVWVGTTIASLSSTVNIRIPLPAIPTLFSAIRTTRSCPPIPPFPREASGVISIRTIPIRAVAV